MSARSISASSSSATSGCRLSAAVARPVSRSWSLSLTTILGIERFGRSSRMATSLLSIGGAAHDGSWLYGRLKRKLGLGSARLWDSCDLAGQGSYVELCPSTRGHKWPSWGLRFSDRMLPIEDKRDLGRVTHTIDVGTAGG